MKSTYIMIFLIAGVVTFISALMCARQKAGMGKAAQNLLVVSFLVILSYLGALTRNSYTGIKIAGGIHLAFMSWQCSFILFFVMRFTGNARYLGKLKRILTPILILDTLLQLSNIFYQHSIMYRMEIIGDDIFFAFHHMPPFYIHLILCYIPVIAAMFMLIKRALINGRFFRSQYITICAILAFILFFNIGYMFSNALIDVSILGYAVAAVILAYYTLRYIPKKLVERIATFTIGNMDSILTVFDNTDAVIYNNDKATRHSLSDKILRRDIFDFLGLPYKGIEEDDDYTGEVTFFSERENREKILGVRFKRIKESSVWGVEQVIGSYIMIDDVTETHKQMLFREYQATHDEITGLLNEIGFYEQTSKLIQENPKQEYCVLMTDIYQFKVYNEVFGKLAGDNLLKKLGEHFSEVMKGLDLPMARYAADRFTFCAPKEMCTEEWINKLADCEDITAQLFKARIYIGLCDVKPEDSLPVICERVAIALNGIKGSASIKYTYYDQSVKDNILRDRQITASFSKALKNGEIRLFIQPQFSLESGKMSGGEVLARWIKSDGTIISPGAFIPILEHNGQISELDYYIWEESFKFAKRLAEDGMPTSLSINLSAQDFFRFNIYDVFVGLTEKYNLPPNYLKLEITESEIMSNMEEQVRLIKRMQAKGFVIEMDDFGNGYSSLHTLKSIPVNALKLDMGFLKGDGDVERSHKIIRHIISLATDINIPVIAEGVETTEQAEFLKAARCQYVQGYLFGRPMPADEFEKLRRGGEYEEMRVGG